MSYIYGKVKNGTVIFSPDVNLADGTPVRVEALEEISLADRLSKVIGCVEGLPPDFAENHDHYIHGTPRK